MYQPNFAFSPRYLSHESAWVGHLPFAYDLMAALRPKVFVELGTWAGDSFFTFCQSIADHHLPTLAYAVDLWEGDQQTGKLDTDEQFRVVHDYCFHNYRKFANLIRSRFVEAAAQFPAEEIDLLHIDGYHSTEAVTEDFETWFPKVRSGGVILFHDIVVRSDQNRKNFGVWKFWNELKKSHAIWEFHQSHGLGVVIKGENPQIRDWLDQATAQPTIHYYQQRGADFEVLRQAEAIRTTRSTELLSALTDLDRQKYENEQLRFHLKQQTKENENQRRITPLLHRLSIAAREAAAEVAQIRKNPLGRICVARQSFKKLGHAIRKADQAMVNIDAKASTRRLAEIVTQSHTILQQARKSPLGKLTIRSAQVRKMANLQTEAEAIVKKLQNKGGSKGQSAPQKSPTEVRGETAAPKALNEQIFHDPDQPEAIFFDPRWYLEQHPEVADSGLSAWKHYSTLGWKNGWNPHPQFDVAWYLDRNPELQEQGTEPLQHFIQQKAPTPAEPIPSRS